MARAVGLAVVVVDAPGHAPLLQAATEDQLQGRQVAFEAETAMEQQAAVVVEEGVEVGPPHLARPLGVGQPGADQHVRLPGPVGCHCLEAVEVLDVGHLTAASVTTVAGVRGPRRRHALWGRWALAAWISAGRGVPSSPRSGASGGTEELLDLWVTPPPASLGQKVRDGDVESEGAAKEDGEGPPKLGN